MFKAKAERGERLSTQIPYGYRRDPNSGKECHLLINDETAPVVKMIFAMCAEGIGPSNIAKALEEKKILDLLFGTFFICGLGEENVTDIPEQAIPFFLNLTNHGWFDNPPV